MPEIVKFFDKTASKIDILKKRIDSKRPKVISIQPFENSAINVDYNISQIIVTFDKELKGKGFSIRSGKKGKQALPEKKGIEYSSDKKKIIIEIKLEPNKEYQFILTGWRIKSKDGFGINDYEINFKTKKKE